MMIASESDLYWMQYAYNLAKKAGQNQEVPVGAVIINEKGEWLGEGYNQVIQQCQPTAHAEILAVQQACQTVGNYRLINTTMYSTLEPCAMCAGAMVHARIKRLCYAAGDLKAGAAGSVFHLLKGYPLNHRVIIEQGVLQNECAALLRNFFQERRS